jgi:GH35 family endo-1,4-beta-xylanase
MLSALNVHEEVPPKGPIRLWDAGVQWADIEKQRGVFDWTKLDAMIDAAGKRSIMIVLGHPPAWAAKGGPDGNQAAWMPAGSNRPPKTMAAWRRYIEAVVTRYKGRVALYQVWNEPADRRFYSGELEELGTLCKVAYQTVKRIDKGARVVSPPLQPRKQAGWARKGKAIIKSLQAAGYPFDIWAMHIYPQKGEGIEGFIRDCKLVIDEIESRPKNNRLWITETNYNLVGEGNPYPVSKQTRLKKQTEDACKMLDITRIYWYSYMTNEPHLFGIIEF